MVQSAVLKWSSVIFRGDNRDMIKHTVDIDYNYISLIRTRW